MTEELTEKEIFDLRYTLRFDAGHFDLHSISIITRLLEEHAEMKKTIAKMGEELELLDALRAAGVDNWDGYDEALERLGED